MRGCADAERDAQGDDPPPLIPCAHCGDTHGAIYQTNDFTRAKSFDRDNLPLDAPSVHLHPDCVGAYFAAQAERGNGQDQSGTTASVPFMITKAMKEQLYARGYSEEEVRNLTPQQAHDALDDSF